MTKTEIKKKFIFDRYADSFLNYVSQFNPELAKVSKKVYACPLCYEPFFDSLSSKEKNFLTLEHNPPKTLGNKKANILTCHQCNSGYGSKFDQKVRHLLATEAFLYSKDSRPIQSNVEIDQYKVASIIRKQGNNIYIQPVEKSNPQAIKHLYEKTKAKADINVSPKLKSPEWNEYSLGMLKIAYLKAFELFGYYFADMGNGANLRDVLAGKLEYPAPNNGVIDIFADDSRVGFEIIREPDHLRAIVLTQKIKFDHLGSVVEKNVPVILPLPSEEGWQLLKNFHNYKDNPVQITLEKIVIMNPPLQTLDEYYGLFYEMKSNN